MHLPRPSLQSRADDIAAHFHETARTRERLTTIRAHLAADLAAKQKDLAFLDGEVTLLGHCVAGFDVLLGALSAQSMGAVESLLTYGLQTAFPEQRLKCRLDTSVKRGQQWVDIRLVRESDGGVVDAPILDAFGGGPAAVISFLLRLLVCRRTGLAPVLLLDEAFSFVSAEYVPGVAQLLRELADKIGLTIVLVTHQPAFLDVAHRAIRIGSDGKGAAVFTKVTV